MIANRRESSTTEELAVAMPLSESMLAVRQYYGQSLQDPELDADDLWLCFLAVDDAVDREHLTHMLAFAVGDAEQTIERCIAAGWVREDEVGRIALTEKAGDLFGRLQPVAQQANEQWRGALADGSESDDDLDLFLNMLQHAGNERVAS